MLFNREEKQNNRTNHLRIALIALLCIALICASSVGLSFLGSHTKYFDVSYINVTNDKNGFSYILPEKVNVGSNQELIAAYSFKSGNENATRRSLPLDSGETENNNEEFHSVGKIGHEVDNSHWALLNLICVIATLLTLLPLLFTRRKFNQLRYAKRLIDKYEDKEEAESDEEESEENEYQSLIDDLKHFIKKMRVGIVIEIAALIVAAVGFIHTEDLTQPIVIRDEWTGIMILIFALSLLTDVLLMRYRGERPPTEEKETEQN